MSMLAKETARRWSRPKKIEEIYAAVYVHHEERSKEALGGDEQSKSSFKLVM